MNDFGLLESKTDELLEILFDYEKSSQEIVIKILNEINEMKKDIDMEEILEIIDQLIEVTMLYIKESTLINYMKYLKVLNLLKININSDEMDIYFEEDE